ncbi:hypothetical protein AWB68_08773 [Caballeronia choica]|uniref:Uncharacterized protein n=1 Tax=Caballeronia choica TaxID=326476 RepID=A0A158L6T1_9BURK|nr:hypothetical protein AWB68_08773 [Caballeronia choica]
MPGLFASTSLQPFTRSSTADTGGPFSMITLPLPLIFFERKSHASCPAWMLFVCTVASAPAAATSTATTTMPAACAFFTAGSIAFGSAALSRMMSTCAEMKLSICVNCLFMS